VTKIEGQRPIRVCHLIGSTGLYGAERWILAQMGYLDRKKIEPSIFNLVDRSGESSAIVLEAKKRGFKALDIYTGGRFNPLAAWHLARFVRQDGLGILHSHGYKSDILGLFAAKLAGAKILSTPHGWSKAADKKLRFYQALGAISLRFMDRVCPLSPGLQDLLIETGVKSARMTMIRNGVDISEIDAARKIGKNNGKRRIGFIGMLIESKGLDDLVDAFFLLRRSDCELFLIGDGPCRDAVLRRFTSVNKEYLIHCPGYVPNRLEYLKSFDLLVLPSLSEGTPRCVMEAQAARVPVVGTDIEGIRNLVKHEHNGLLVPPKNPSLLAKAIDRILDFPELGAAFAAEGRKLIESQFSAARMAKEYESLYLSLLEQR
jgi:glycosyltransferase involved in cell wall biosynthesis